MQRTSLAIAQPVPKVKFYLSLYVIAFMAEDKSKSADALKSIPPNMSVIQCTPLKTRKTSIKIVKSKQNKFTANLIFSFPIIRLKSIIALGNTQRASIVVEEG